MRASFVALLAACRALLFAGAGLCLAAAGPTQPQSVSGPCHVKDFFIVSLGTSDTEMTIDNDGQACRLTLFNPDLQAFQTAALITSQPSHGQATARLTDANFMAEITYTPQPGYAGDDRFAATIEPNDKAVIVSVTVRPGMPPR